MTAPFSPAGFSAFLVGDESLTIACGDMVLAGGHRIAAVITRDQDVRHWAERHGIGVLEAPKDLLATDHRADWLLSIANLRLIPDAVLARADKGAINFHDGPLPSYAGLNTPAWAIINGETTHGVSWHVIEGGVDEGDLVARRAVEIGPQETAFGLNSKCYAAGMESFAAVLAQLEANRLDRMPQDLSQRSYFARDQRPDGMGVLDFSQSAETLSALVRGLDFGTYWNPLTTAKVICDGQVLRVGTLRIAPDAQTGAPGEVLAVGADEVSIGTATAAVTLSGLTDMAGQPVSCAALFTQGAVLETAGLPPLDVTQEHRWRAALARSGPIALPFARREPAAPAALASRPLAAPATLSVTDRAVAASLCLLRSSGLASGWIALPAGADHPLATDWVPLRVAATGADLLSEVETALGAALETASKAAGFAVDLPLRDPAIGGPATPRVALSLDGRRVEGADLTVHIDATATRLEHDTTRLDDTAAALIAARLDACFAAFAEARTCSDLWTLPDAERTRLMSDWNDTGRNYEATTIHAAFEAQVARTPDATAVVFEDHSLSYAALNAKANRLAHALRARGAGPGQPIGLCVTRSLDLLIGALGILKAGAAYVPLDPAYPADRIAHYISDSGARLIVTQSALQDQLPDHTAEIVLVDKHAGAELSQDNPAPTATPADLAYLIYTSGSTGTPKGVMVNHGNVANFFVGMDDRIDHATGSVWLAVTSLSFDISVLELFWTLARGFKLVLAGDESRTLVSNGPIVGSDRKIDFNLMYWGNDDGVGPKKYELLLEGAKFADRHGFNAVWTPERHFHAFGGPYPNPSVTGAAVAAVTTNLAVRAGSCVAPLHHPARIAEEWAVIDNLTNGRVGLAIASGWQPDDFVLRPENTPPDNKPAMYAAIDQLRRLWRGEAVEFPKKDGTPHAIVTQPRPVSAEVPLWVTTAGNPQTWKEAGEIGANVLTHLLGQSMAEVADKITIYHQALRDAGHDPADFTVTLMLHTYLAETRAEAEAVARGPMKDYLRSAAALIKQYAWAFPAFKRPEGTQNAFDLDLEGLSEEELDAILEFAFQRYFNDSGLFGTVADGVARAEELKRIGVDEIACLIDYGIDSTLVMEGLKPLAEVLARANAGVEIAADDHSLAAQILRHKVSHLQCTPSMAQMLVTNPEARQALGGVRHLMIGGEALPGALAEALLTQSTASVQNMYGPTETTIWSTTHALTQANDATTPIGTPIANTQVYVLDDKMAVQPIGVEGELWIGGDGVTDGYWNRAGMTAEKFVSNPFGSGRLYRTGDLAAWDPAGFLRFTGRADAQVKIRGHRIEPGEIEARMAAIPGITQAVVVVRDGPGGAQLVGYVTATGPLDPETVRRKLAAELPAIMVPSAIVTLERMPLTPNKKIDRKALPAPQARTAPESTASDAPKGETSARIAAIWSRLLGQPDIRGEDNFFALGGHSLLAVQAHRDIRESLGAERLSITDIFRFPALDALARHIDGLKGGAPRAPDPEPAPEADRTETMSKRRAMRAGRSKAGA